MLVYNETWCEYVSSDKSTKLISPCFAQHKKGIHHVKPKQRHNRNKCVNAPSSVRRRVRQTKTNTIFVFFSVNTIFSVGVRVSEIACTVDVLCVRSRGARVHDDREGCQIPCPTFHIGGQGILFTVPFHVFCRSHTPTHVLLHVRN